MSCTVRKISAFEFLELIVETGLKLKSDQVSGQRLWGWVQARFGSPAQFFERFWVHNYCPLLFVEASGK
jgi:single-strand selective monofunctional uracil DNA glycosylase